MADTHMYAHPYPPLISRAQTLIHLGAHSCYHFQDRFFYLHRQVIIYWGFGWWWQTHTHAHALLLAQTHILPSRLQEHFPDTHAALHATCVLFHQCGANLLRETVVLQSVLWDIRAWSARFLVCLSAGDVEWHFCYHSIAPCLCKGNISVRLLVVFRGSYVFSFNIMSS